MHEGEGLDGILSKLAYACAYSIISAFILQWDKSR